MYRLEWKLKQEIQGQQVFCETYLQISILWQDRWDEVVPLRDVEHTLFVEFPLEVPLGVVLLVHIIADKAGQIRDCDKIEFICIVCVVDLQNQFTVWIITYK